MYVLAPRINFQYEVILLFRNIHGKLILFGFVWYLESVAIYLIFWSFERVFHWIYNRYISNYNLPKHFHFQALEQIILYKDWTNFTILYVQGHSLSRVYNLLKMGNDTDRSTVTIKELSGDDYRYRNFNSTKFNYKTRTKLSLEQSARN